MSDPITGRNLANPTMTQPIISQAERDIVLRYRRIRAGILARLTTLELTAAQVAAILADLDVVVNRWLLEGGPSGLWFSEYTQESAQEGAKQAVANLGRLTVDYTRTIEQVVYSDAFINRVALARVADYSEFTNLSADLRNRLASAVTQAVANGDGVKVATKAIQASLETSAKKARMYAQTSIPGALREARMAENDYARESLGIRTALLWTSALKPTTRANHASRHGRTYSTNEVRDFYSRDGNRYNCYCAVTDCLIDEEGKLIASDRLKDSMAKEKRNWETENE